MITCEQSEFVSGVFAASKRELRTEGRGQRVELDTGVTCRIVGYTVLGGVVMYYSDSDYTFEEACRWLDSTHRKVGQ